VLRLLVALAQGPELKRNVDDELGAVLAHDATAANPLLPTLQAYLASDGNKSRTANALFVQSRGRSGHQDLVGSRVRNAV
jgi:purine catabolism regulator